MSRKPLSVAIFCLLLAPGIALAEGTFSYVGDCDSQRISASPDMQRAFRAISAKLGKNIPLNSCYRSQGHQNKILKRHGCRPYGKKNCNGTVARVSYHSTGIAGDFTVNVATGPLCRAMDQVRTELMGGVGGVGGYGSGAAHFDNRNYRCSYNICGSVISGGCKGRSRRGASFGAPPGGYGSGQDQTDIQPYNSTKVDEYNKERVGNSGPTHWLRWLLRVLTFGLIK